MTFLIGCAKQRVERIHNSLISKKSFSKLAINQKYINQVTFNQNSFYEVSGVQQTNYCCLVERIKFIKHRFSESRKNNFKLLNYSNNKSRPSPIFVLTICFPGLWRFGLWEAQAFNEHKRKNIHNRMMIPVYSSR